MEKQPYSKPALTRIDFEDKEVASMATPCKDVSIPDILGGCTNSQTGGTNFGDGS